MADPIVSGVTTTGAVAVTPHHLASRAAIEMIGRGGNAVDAALAANAVLGVVLPTTCGIGGDLFAMVHTPGAKHPLVLNASGRCGSGFDAEQLRAAGHEAMPLFDARAITVPGCVDGWIALSERCGTLALAEVLEPAIAHAERGFQTSQELADALELLQPVIARQPSADELCPDGRIPLRGEATFRPDYAAALRRIGSEGRDAFYAGPVAEAVAAATGEVVTRDDLESNRVDWVDPIGIEAFGLRAWTVPPNSQGYVTLAACRLLQELDPPSDPADPAFHHAVVEAYRAVAWERDDLVADAGHAPLPPDKLLDPQRLAALIEGFDPDHIAVRPATRSVPGGTAYLAVIDGNGIAVSLIQSNFAGIGSLISAGSTGIWLHNRGAGFSLEPGHPNEAATGKRPLHTLAPTLWTRDGQAALMLGTRGGHQQPQYLLQTAALLLHAGITPADLQLLARWHMAPGTAGSEIKVEAHLPEPAAEGLRQRGHEVTTVPSWQGGWGPVSLIAVSADGTRSAAADPRVSTATAAD